MSVREEIFGSLEQKCPNNRQNLSKTGVKTTVRNCLYCLHLIVAIIIVFIFLLSLRQCRDRPMSTLNHLQCYVCTRINTWSPLLECNISYVQKCKVWLTLSNQTLVYTNYYLHQAAKQEQKGSFGKQIPVTMYKIRMKDYITNI